MNVKTVKSKGSAQKLVIGPLNQSGQARAWATSVGQNLGLESVSVARDGVLAARLRGVQMNGRAHASIPHPRITPPWLGSAWTERLLAGATHILNESNSAMVKSARNAAFEDEIRGFQDRGIALAVVFHGSEVRDPQRHAEQFEDSFFRDAPADWVSVLTRIARKNRAFAEHSGLPVYVTTPDLLADLPSARLLPLAIDPLPWSGAGSILAGRSPRVLHRPSRSQPPIKGTQYIEPVLLKLEAAGRIEFVRTDEVPHSQMLALVGQVDIVVDQIQTGAYGVAAVEAMAAGRLVIGNVSRESAEALDTEVPIVNASPTSFGSIMEDLLADPNQIASIAGKGPSYVEKWHTGVASTDSLRSFLLAD